VEITLIAEIAIIIGSALILLTLMFAIIELKKNVDKALTATILTRSQQHRVRAFLKYAGAMKCYEHIVSGTLFQLFGKRLFNPRLNNDIFYLIKYKNY
jgi:hypothetical protein